MSADTVNQTRAAKLAGVGIGQVRKWVQNGVLEPLPRQSVPRTTTPVRFRRADVQVAAAWAQRSIRESEAARMLGVTRETLRGMGVAGLVGPVTQYGVRLYYDREHVEAEADRRLRLLSMRAVGREFGLPSWILKPAIDEGLIPTEQGSPH